ncbi:MAG: hypothetical protein IPM32_18265 [Ignavibacteriae bacterium]|nr:hypothetical protein [Ignavibacteriota bacterium]
MSSISEFGNALESLGSHGKTFVSYFNAALQSAIKINEAINTMKTDQLSGTLGIFSGFASFFSHIFGFSKGGTVTNQNGNISIEPHKKFASGVSNFTVPAGFNKDNYLIGVQSGEKVSVTPAGQSNNLSTH